MYTNIITSRNHYDCVLDVNKTYVYLVNIIYVYLFVYLHITVIKDQLYLPRLFFRNVCTKLNCTYKKKSHLYFGYFNRIHKLAQRADRPIEIRRVYSFFVSPIRAYAKHIHNT